MRPSPGAGPLLLAVTALAGCALPGGRGPAPGAPGEVAEAPAAIEPTPPLPENTDEAIAELYRRLATGSAADSVALRARLAGVLEAAGRHDAALLEYLQLTGTAPPRQAAAAWDGIARVRRSLGEPAGAVEAEMQAFAVAPEDERSQRETRLARSVRALELKALRALERRAGGAEGGVVLARELAARGDPDTIVVALLLPMTGRFESIGRAFRVGAELALGDRTNRRPRGRPVRLVVVDTGGELAQGSRAARQAILEEGATALVGPLLSVPALAAGALADAFGIPLIAPTATDPEVQRMGPHVLSLDPPAFELTDPLARLATETLGARRFAALVPREPTAEEREREFRAAVARGGAEWVLSVAFDPGERDFRRLLEMLEDAAPDVVYVPAEATDLEALVPQLEFYEFGPRIAGHGGWASSRVFRPGLASLEGSILSVEAAVDPSSDFLKHLSEVVEPIEKAEPTRFHIQGYRAVASILFAVDHGAVGPEALGETLRLRASWPSQPEGEQIRLLTVRDGVLVPAIPENLKPRPPSRAASSPDGRGGG